MASTEHAVLFSMLYKVERKNEQLEMANIANIVAYAQMYMCLPLIAAQVREHLLSRDDLWTHVKRQPLFHLGLAHKLRCAEVFEDALRHLVGRGTHYSDLEAAGLDQGNAATLMYDLRTQLDSKVEELRLQIDRLTLTEYVKHSNSRHPGDPVGTTFLSATWDAGLSTEEKATWLSKCVFRDWFQMQLSGQGHWSHIRKYKYRGGQGNYFSGGHFHPSTLREVCERVRRAHLEDRPLTLFEADVVERIMTEFNLETSDGFTTAKVITGTLADLVKSVYEISASMLGVKQAKELPFDELRIWTFDNAATCANRSHKPQSDCPGKERDDNLLLQGTRYEGQSECAKDDTGCCYFTNLYISDDLLPWHDEQEWEDFHLEGLKSASNEWLEAVDLVGDEVAETEPFENLVAESDVE